MERSHGGSDNFQQSWPPFFFFLSTAETQTEPKSEGVCHVGSRWVRGELAEPLCSRLGEDEDRKSKADATREEDFETSDKSKEEIQRLPLFFHPPFFFFFCFIFAFFFLVFVSRLILFLLAMAAIPTARRPPAPSDGAFFVFFLSLSSPPQRDGAVKKKKGGKNQEGLSAKMQIIQNVCTFSALYLKHTQCVTTGVEGGRGG